MRLDVEQHLAASHQWAADADGEEVDEGQSNTVVMKPVIACGASSSRLLTAAVMVD